MARLLNDHLAGVVGQNPKRFVGLGTLPMQAPELAVEVKKRKKCCRTKFFEGKKQKFSIYIYKLIKTVLNTKIIVLNENALK